MGRKLTQTEFIKRVKKASPNLIVKGEYKNNRSKIDVECKICNLLWKPKAQSIMDNENKNGIYCPSCNGTQPKTFGEFKALICSTENQIEVINCDLNDDDLINTKEYFNVFNNKCKHNWTTNYNRASRHGVNCPYCSNKKVLKGFNDISTTTSWMNELLKNKEDAFKHTRCSNKKLDWICKCGRTIRDKTPNEVYQRGLSCPNCSDGISYPEKIISNMLSELKVNFKTQYIINGYSYKYDFYLIDYNYIIEAHGNQHYSEHGFNLIDDSARTLNEEQENDLNKMNLAISLGYQYIVLDCRKSEINYIKKSVLESELSKLFNNIRNIDWDKIHINSLKSKLVYICELYNENYTIEEICALNGISRNACMDYLRKGTESSLCKYSGIINRDKALNSIHENTKISIRCKTTNEIFDSLTSAVNKYGFSISLLSAHLKGKRRRAGVDPITGQDLIWEFV